VTGAAAAPERYPRARQTFGSATSRYPRTSCGFGCGAPLSTGQCSGNAYLSHLHCTTWVRNAATLYRAIRASRS